MKTLRHAVVLVILGLFVPVTMGAAPAVTQPNQVVRHVLDRVLALIEPPAQTPAQTFTAKLVLTKAEGLSDQLLGASIDLAYQAPDHLRISAKVRDQDYSIGRNGTELWVYEPDKRFGLVGSPGVPRFADDPRTVDRTALSPFRIPLAVRLQLMTLAMMAQTQVLAGETIENVNCQVVALVAPQLLVQAVGVPSARIELAVRETDGLPARIRFSDGQRMNVELQVQDPKFSEPWPAEQWKIHAGNGAKVQTVALSHLTNFLQVAQSMLNNHVRTLGPATGQRKLLASVGQGRLEEWDGTRVMFLKGTPEEMGRQHGTLLKKEIRAMADHMLYGVGVASSFAKGSWFFGDMEQAQKRITPFVSPRYFAEIDALAAAAGIDVHEARLANFFPELFHCSGFAVFGDATVGGRLYHGRVLDYIRGMGLEQNAVVMIYQPNEGNAWVNVGYAGFIGSVTAMNEKHIAIGEMGGRGEGNWDGKPMAQLVREVMERANTLDEAVEIMRKGPRTCEYYYVISDGNTRRAVGIEATPTKFVTVGPGEFHPQLTKPMKDTVLLSAGDRYEKLVERVKANYGKLDADVARSLMERPVAMKSNIHSVLFAPETLDFWVANADSQNVASHTRYTHYNLAELLKAEPAK
ncbi:MAG: C45 family autoproteolytic acyltransferase/hydrolase [Bacillota bacterium]